MVGPGTLNTVVSATWEQLDSRLSHKFAGNVTETCPVLWTLWHGSKQEWLSEFQHAFVWVHPKVRTDVLQKPPPSSFQ